VFSVLKSILNAYFHIYKIKFILLIDSIRISIISLLFITQISIWDEKLESVLSFLHHFLEEG